MFRYAGTTYQSVSQLRRRLERDRTDFEAQAAVYRRLLDSIEDLHADAEAAGRMLEADVLAGEVARYAGLEQEMQSSADHAAIELAALAGRVA